MDSLFHPDEYSAAWRYSEYRDECFGLLGSRAMKLELTASPSPSKKTTRPTGCRSPPPDFSMRRSPRLRRRPGRSRGGMERRVGVGVVTVSRSLSKSATRTHGRSCLPSGSCPQSPAVALPKAIFSLLTDQCRGASAGPARIVRRERESVSSITQTITASGNLDDGGALGLHRRTRWRRSGARERSIPLRVSGRPRVVQVVVGVGEQPIRRRGFCRARGRSCV